MLDFAITALGFFLVTAWISLLAWLLWDINNRLAKLERKESEGDDGNH